MNDPFATLDNLLRLIDARLAALRAAQSPPYAGFKADYERRAADYAVVIEANARRLLTYEPTQGHA